MEGNEFKCEICEEVFNTGWTNEEAEAEMWENFGPDICIEDCAVICDDCYKESIKRFTNEKNLG